MNNIVLKFVGLIKFFFINRWGIWYRIFDRDNKYKGKPLCGIDINTTSYNLLPFFIDELTFSRWKDIIINSEFHPNYNTCFYVFNHKGDVIHHSEFRINLMGSEEKLDEFLNFMLEGLLIACVDYLMDTNFYWKNFKFYLLITDRDITNDILYEHFDDKKY